MGEDDAYGTSVVQGVLTKARALGFHMAPTITYDAYDPDWSTVMNTLKADGPEVLFLASYIPDGVAFRRAMLSSGVKVGAMIGTTMAECVPDFGNELGKDAVGIFGSDRPGPDFDPAALSPTGRQAYAILARAVRAAKAPTVRGGPTEEEMSGFTAAWTLLHDVMTKSRTVSPLAVATAARAVTIPSGSLPNGAGLKFSSTGPTLGQNVRATGAIWQWQAPSYNVVVWPPTFATAKPILIPLPVKAPTTSPAIAHPAYPSPGW